MGDSAVSTPWVQRSRDQGLKAREPLPSPSPRSVCIILSPIDIGVADPGVCGGALVRLIARRARVRRASYPLHVGTKCKADLDARKRPHTGRRRSGASGMD